MWTADSLHLGMRISHHSISDVGADYGALNLPPLAVPFVCMSFREYLREEIRPGRPSRVSWATWGMVCDFTLA